MRGMIPYAGDDPIEGGYYTSSIIQSAKNWRTKSNTDLTKQYSRFSVVRAHDSAVNNVSRLSGGTQNPKMEKPRSEPYFPFAIIA